MATEKENGCLGLFFKGILIIFLIGNGYAVVRVEWARIQVYRLARQLDYTPERYLHSALVYHTTNLVTGAAESYVALYYTTPLTPATYRERLAQIDPEVSDDSGILSTTNYLIRELGIAVFPQENNNRDQPDDYNARQPPFPVRWDVPSYEVSIDFQVFSPVVLPTGHPQRRKRTHGCLSAQLEKPMQYHQSADVLRENSNLGRGVLIVFAILLILGVSAASPAMAQSPSAKAEGTDALVPQASPDAETAVTITG